MVLKLLGNSCSCYNNNCINKMWAPALTFYIYTWFYWHCFHTVLYNSSKCSFPCSKLKFSIINSYEHFKLIYSNPRLNTVELVITHCSSYSYVSYNIFFSISDYVQYSRHYIEIFFAVPLSDTLSSSNCAFEYFDHLITM